VKWLAAFLLALLVLIGSSAADAHELRPGALSLHELEPGRYGVMWSAPSVAPGADFGGEPRFPAHCRANGATLDCGQRGLDGTIALPWLAGTLSRVVVYVRHHDGSATTAVLSGDSPSLTVKGPQRTTSTSAVAKDYALLGIEHILGGVDHLLFVLGLALLVGFRRQLVATVTAFTLAHSLTLAAAALGWARVPRGPVEAVIALSILLLAVECSAPRDSLARRAPWAVAFSFGLLHGFGFAGALSDVGLPEGHVATALAFFNVGVELGQLAVLGAAFVVSRQVAARLPEPARLQRVAVYAMGSLAAFWSIERTLVAFTR
jgi:hydrogenase/urease accessory protein HupE